MVLVKIIPHRGGFLLGSMHCFSINYTFAQVGGKVWVGTIIVFCAYKNMCLAAVRFLRVLKHVSMPFFATIRFLHLLKHVSMSLLCCRMVGRMFLRGLLLLPRRPQYPLLWRHRIPAPPTGGTRPSPSQSTMCGEPIHDRWHAATPSTTGGPTDKLWICT